VKVSVCGAAGRMGTEVCRAVSAQSDMELVCAIDTQCTGRPLRDLVSGLESDLKVSDDLDELAGSSTSVMVDFSISTAARRNIPFCIEKGINCVVGTTGLTRQDLDSWEEAARAKGLGCLVAPNFAVGAVLMMVFSRQAAKYMEACEIIELHHAGKLDAPSGTSRLTAEMILGETGKESEEGPRGLNVGGINIHSVRLPGLVAHQEVIFGGQGQSLSIRHDSFDRTSFMPGVIMAIRKVRELDGLVIGLEKILGL
jgi:4-hydroxy-tetrahydrodipicolinate reductase